MIFLSYGVSEIAGPWIGGRVRLQQLLDKRGDFLVCSF